MLILIVRRRNECNWLEGTYELSRGGHQFLYQLSNFRGVVV